jgi:hypothetical protein
MGQDGAGGVAQRPLRQMPCPFGTSSMAGQGHSDAQEELAANLRTETNKIPLVSRDSPSVFFGYSDFTDAVDFKEKQKVPHSYSRAEENARFADGVRDDEIKKDYINPEIALIASFQLLPIDIRVVYNFLLLTKTFE